MSDNSSITNSSTNNTQNNANNTTNTLTNSNIFDIKFWKNLIWHKRQLIIRENDYVIVKKDNKNNCKTFSLVNAVLVDQTEGTELSLIIYSGESKCYIKPNSKEDKDKIISKITEIIKKYSSKTAFSAEYQRYNREIAKFHDSSPYDGLIRKLNIFQNLMLEMNQKLDTLKGHIQKKSAKINDLMSAYNNLTTIKEEMKKQFDEIIAGVYNYHDMMEGGDKKKGKRKIGEEGKEGEINTTSNENNINENLQIDNNKDESGISSSSEDDGDNTPKENSNNKYRFLCNKISDFYNESFDFPKREKLENKIKCPQNMVKELMTVITKKLPVPIYFNEPLSMLQKQCEKFYYMDLLTKASRQDTPELQMCYISAFIIAEIFTNIGRNLKPFSPLIGETFEYFDNNKQFRYFAEQISHNPQITGFIGETPDWAYYGDTDNTNSFKIFKGAYELVFKNKVTILLKKAKDCYVFNRPIAMVKGMVKPPMHSDYSGTVTVEHVDNPNYKCVLEFVEENWKGDLSGQFSGKIYSDPSTVTHLIGGNWKEEVYMTDENGENKISLIKFDKSMEYINNTYESYVLPGFCCNLNNLPEKLRECLPKTDSRFREDMKMLENGDDLNKAQQLKLAYEEKQRKELDVPEHKVKYFDIIEDEIKGEKIYVPNGKYWEERKKVRNVKIEENEDKTDKGKTGKDLFDVTDYLSGEQKNNE